MKIYTNFKTFLVGVGVFSLLIGTIAHAAMVPNMSVYAITGGTTAQVTVFGADPNASVLLHYPSSASVASTNIGTTNSSGYLTETIDASTYGIASGASVYVTVDGQSSQASLWPNYTTSGTLALSQTSLTLSSGQSSVVSAGVSAALSVSSNSNPSVATASVSGNQITVTGFSSGTTNITICASGVGCATMLVTVQSSSQATANISFSQSNVSVAVGQSQTVAISGSGNYYVSANSSPGFVTASLSGSILTIGGVNPGPATITVCSSGGNGTTCSSVNIVVTQSTTTTANSSTTQTPLTFSQSDVTLSVGQNQSVSIYGGAGSFYVSTNSAPSSVTANVSNSSVVLTGVAFGGDNITVCSINGQCGIVYAYVSAGTSAAPSSAVTTTATPAITSFNLSSNDANGSFIGSGNALTLSFSANQAINIPSMTVAGSAVAINGSGNGPYTATYTMTGNETLPIPIAITFSNPAGSSASAYFSIGSGVAAPTVSNVSSPVSTSNNYDFTQYLYNGSTGAQVTALQRRLTSDGVYSGPITGTFGDLTETAVKAYQKKHGIDQLGVIGPATRTLLNEGI